MFDLILKAVDADKLGGWVRAAVASGLAIAATKLGIVAFASPDFQTAAGIFVSTIVVGAWSHWVKR